MKELRLAGIADMAAGNDFLPGFMARFNERFATPAADRQDMHRPLNMPPDRLADVLCWREQRYVGQQLAFSYQRKRIILDETDLTRGLAGKYVDTYAFADGGLDVRWKGLSLSYRVFDKDQRVTHAAIVENKRLSEVLAYVKALQDQARPPSLKTNSEKNGYQKTGRKRAAPPGISGQVAAHRSPPTGSAAYGGSAAIIEVSAAPP